MCTSLSFYDHRTMQPETLTVKQELARLVAFTVEHDNRFYSKLSRLARKVRTCQPEQAGDHFRSLSRYAVYVAPNAWEIPEWTKFSSLTSPVDRVDILSLSMNVGAFLRLHERRDLDVPTKLNDLAQIEHELHCTVFSTYDLIDLGLVLASRPHSRHEIETSLATHLPPCYDLPSFRGTTAVWRVQEPSSFLRYVHRKMFDVLLPALVQASDKHSLAAVVLVSLLSSPLDAVFSQSLRSIITTGYLRGVVDSDSLKVLFNLAFLSAALHPVLTQNKPLYRLEHVKDFVLSLRPSGLAEDGASLLLCAPTSTPLSLEELDALVRSGNRLDRLETKSTSR